MEIRGLSIEVVRKDIKNLHVGVYPPGGRVRVAAPMRLDDEAVRLAIVSRLGWIHRQRGAFERQDRQSKREMINGESHYFRGRRYRLAVIEREAIPSVRLRNNTIIELGVRCGSSAGKRRAILEAWYRARLAEQLSPLCAKWQPRVGVEIESVRIRKMKTRWGSCNASNQRIWLNLELAKKPVSSVEYIIVHEMVHLIERKHNDNFRALMNRLLPTWRLMRDELNRAPLSHDDWRY